MNKVLILSVLAIALIGQADCRSMNPGNRFACGVNEFLNECAVDRICERTCVNMNEHLNCPPICVERCACIDGHVRNNGGQCIPVASC
ncbi:hypothetical protein Bhyg_14546 [Pseudolycoriella hygida]|uniref:TIL domain-containing protein n=1 Tax=Pseudolycoriella hygida TaxID=35572 RepID=A0A9Q0MQ53_9DIPT|nr:hypothetical protein Bhyg_14546 [Pseudolycoriella hygida]